MPVTQSLLLEHFESSGGQLTAAACEANTQSMYRLCTDLQIILKLKYKYGKYIDLTVCYNLQIVSVLGRLDMRILYFVSKNNR